jgi:hypothetical protein
VETWVTENGNAQRPWNERPGATGDHGKARAPVTLT